MVFFLKISLLLIHTADHTVYADSDHYFYTCSYVLNFHNLHKQRTLSLMVGIWTWPSGSLMTYVLFFCLQNIIFLSLPVPFCPCKFIYRNLRSTVREVKWNFQFHHWQEKQFKYGQFIFWPTRPRPIRWSLFSHTVRSSGKQIHATTLNQTRLRTKTRFSTWCLVGNYILKTCCMIQ